MQSPLTRFALHHDVRKAVRPPGREVPLLLRFRKYVRFEQEIVGNDLLERSDRIDRIIGLLTTWHVCVSGRL